MERQLELAPAFSASLGAKILPNARAAGDLDGDGATELVFGSVSGAVAVFKIAGDELVLWRSCALDGSVTAICVHRRPEREGVAGAAAMMRAVVATSESKCYVFQDVDTEEPFGPFAEFSVALNASAVAVIENELVIGTRDGRILVFDLGDGRTGEYKQLARFEIAAEIESMRAFAVPFVRSNGSSILLIWCTSGEIFCYTPKSETADAGVEAEGLGTGSVTLWNGMSGEKEDLENMVDAISVDGVDGHVAHVLMGEKVTLMSPLLEKMWEVRLPEAIVSLDKMRLPSRNGVGQETDVLAACTWSGQLWVMKNSETYACFRAMLPAASMFTTTVLKDDNVCEPIIVVIATSGFIFVFAEISDTIARAFDSSTLDDGIKQSAVINLLDTDSKRAKLLERLTHNTSEETVTSEMASVSIEDIVRAAMNYPEEGFWESK